MSQELIYTSAATGLKPGSKGFCTVAMTAGLPAGWVDRLEPLSAYRAIYPLGDPKSDRNPVNFSHWRVAVSGKTKSVLSRVAFAGADYSGRSNKLAHHIVLEPPEQAAGGPAWMLLKAKVMRTTWAGAPQQFPAGPKLPMGDRASSVCTAWASIRGDAGWAGALAESFVADPAKPAYLIYSPGTDILLLFDESLSLLPPTQRWSVTFSTFFTELPLNLTCAWRAVIAGTPAATEAVRLGPRALVIDLTKAAGSPPTGVYSDAARAGSGPVISAVAARTSTPSNKVATVAAPAVDPEDSGIAEVSQVKETAATATVRGRKRLAATTGGLETQIPVGLSVEEADGWQNARPVVANRSVSRRVFAVSIIGCLMLGAAGSMSIWWLMHAQFQKAKADTALAQIEIETARTTVADAKLEGNAATQATATQTARAEGVERNIIAVEATNRTLTEALAEARTHTSSKSEQPTGAPGTQPTLFNNGSIPPPPQEPSWKPVQRLIVGRTSERPDYVDNVGLMASQRSTVTVPHVPPGASQLAIAWPNGAATCSYTGAQGRVNLCAETRVDGSSGLLRVLATHANDTAGLTSDTETPLVITLRGDKMTFDCSDAKVEDKVLQIIKLCVFEISDNDSHTARFAFHQEDQSIGLSIQSYPMEIPSGVATELTSDPLDKWTSMGSGKDSIVYSSNANPKIQFRVWMSSTAGGSQSFQWDWPDNSKHYADAASLASKLQSECDQLSDYSKAGKDYPGAGTGYYDSALPPLFVEIKAQAERLCTAKKTYDGRTGNKPNLEDIPDWKKENGKFYELIKELKVRCKIKQAFADQCRLDEFNVSLALPNGLELKKFHLKPLPK